MEQTSRKYRILSIDAWAGSEPFSWEWNNWFHVGDLESLPENDNDIIKILIDMEFLNEKALKKCVVRDDEYNLVVEHVADACPMYAIEYGNEE